MKEPQDEKKYIWSDWERPGKFFGDREGTSIDT